MASNAHNPDANNPPALPLSSIGARRVQRELAELQQMARQGENGASANVIGISANTVGDSLALLKAQIDGPTDTPYSGGRWEVRVRVPPAYPFTPVSMCFCTRLWHPNVSSQTGAICLDLLGAQWTAAMTLRTALLSVQALLADPKPSDPQDAVVARQMLTTPDLFKATARYWAQYYAGAEGETNPEFDEKIKQVSDAAGCSKERALTALSNKNWDVGRALVPIPDPVKRKVKCHVM